jgi:hypothetical protein
MTPRPDRRTHRSSERHLALRYQLEHARSTGGLEAIALADASGLLVASAGDDALCEELSALAPLVGRSPAAMCVGHALATRPLCALGEPLFLVSQGGNLARDAVLSESARGVVRILESA